MKKSHVKNLKRLLYSQDTLKSCSFLQLIEQFIQCNYSNLCEIYILLYDITRDYSQNRPGIQSSMSVPRRHQTVFEQSTDLTMATIANFWPLNTYVWIYHCVGFWSLFHHTTKICLPGFPWSCFQSGCLFVGASSMFVIPVMFVTQQLLHSTISVLDTLWNK